MNEDPVMLVYDGTPRVGYINGNEEGPTLRTDFYDFETIHVHPEAESVILKEKDTLSLKVDGLMPTNLNPKIYDQLCQKVEEFAAKHATESILEVEVQGTGRYAGFGILTRLEQEDMDPTAANELPYLVSMVMDPDDAPTTFRLGIFDEITIYDVDDDRIEWQNRNI